MSMKEVLPAVVIVSNDPSSASVKGMRYDLQGIQGIQKDEMTKGY